MMSVTSSTMVTSSAMMEISSSTMVEASMVILAMMTTELHSSVMMIISEDSVMTKAMAEASLIAAEASLRNVTSSEVDSIVVTWRPVDGSVHRHVKAHLSLIIN
jgi:hypothetical protein